MMIAVNGLYAHHIRACLAMKCLDRIIPYIPFCLRTRWNRNSVNAEGFDARAFAHRDDTQHDTVFGGIRIMRAVHADIEYYRGRRIAFGKRGIA